MDIISILNIIDLIDIINIIMIIIHIIIIIILIFIIIVIIHNLIHLNSSTTWKSHHSTQESQDEEELGVDAADETQDNRKKIFC